VNNNGVFVTVWGKGFGATQGSITVGGGAVASIVSWTQGANVQPSWSLDRVVFQLGSSAATGNIVLTNANGSTNSSVPFTVRPGRILFVTPAGGGAGTFAAPMSPATAYNTMLAGDTFYFRSGSYPNKYDSTGWGNNNFALGPSKGGTAGNPIAFVGYPGETATLTSPSHHNFDLQDNSGHSDYITVANLTLVASVECVNGGGSYTPGGAYTQGAAGVRVVGNVLSATYTGTTGGSGLVMPQGNNWSILGNEFKDTGVAFSNLNHSIYNQLGASGTDIGWNYFHNLVMGHVVMIHNDNVGVGPLQFTNIRIHDNVITQGPGGNSRGIGISNMTTSSSGSIYNNVLYDLGGDFSALAIYNGSWKVYNNTFYNIHSTFGMFWLSRQSLGNQSAHPTTEVFNNIFYSDGASPYINVDQGALLSDITLSNNLYFNLGVAPLGDAAAVNADPMFVNAASGTFRLNAGSPAINAGTSAVSSVVTIDVDGNGRPQQGLYDIGAFETP